MIHRVFLDNCCFSRSFDDQSQAKIARETEAIIKIFEKADQGLIELITSDSILDECLQDPNPGRQWRTRLLIEGIPLMIEVGHPEFELAKEFEGSKVKDMDALHLAAAQLGGVSVFLTTDKALIYRANDSSDCHIEVANPADWVDLHFPGS
jgi:hypothetical protein